MEVYQNRSGNSGIVGFEIGADFIRLQFSDRKLAYTYSYAKAGREHVEEMKQLALKGSGLNTYLNKHVKDLFD